MHRLVIICNRIIELLVIVTDFCYQRKSKYESD